MPIEINRSNGTILARVEDDTIDQQSSSIGLIGIGATNVTDAFNENFVHILENFASEFPPRKPMTGQIWYDTRNKTMKFWSNALWVDLGDQFSRTTLKPLIDLHSTQIDGNTRTLDSHKNSIEEIARALYGTNYVHFDLYKNLGFRLTFLEQVMGVSTGGQDTLETRIFRVEQAIDKKLVDAGFIGGKSADTVITVDNLLSELVKRDGPGSRLNADRLDGLESADFVRTNEYNGQAIIDHLRNTSGPGSGLHADILDGHHASDFVLKADLSPEGIFSIVRDYSVKTTGLNADTLGGRASADYAVLQSSPYFGGDVSAHGLVARQGRLSLRSLDAGSEIRIVAQTGTLQAIMGYDAASESIVLRRYATLTPDVEGALTIGRREITASTQFLTLVGEGGKALQFGDAQVSFVKRSGQGRFTFATNSTGRLDSGRVAVVAEIDAIEGLTVGSARYPSSGDLFMPWSGKKLSETLAELPGQQAASREFFVERNLKISLAHPGGVPRQLSFMLRFRRAIHGYAVGDHIPVYPTADRSSGFCAWVDSTHVRVLFADRDDVFTIHSLTTNAPVVLAASDAYLVPHINV